MSVTVKRSSRNRQPNTFIQIPVFQQVLIELHFNHIIPHTHNLAQTYTYITFAQTT